MKKLKTAAASIKSYRGLFVLLIALCVLASVFSFQYYKSLYATIREESKTYLQEVSRRVGSNLDQIVKSNFDILNMMVATIEEADGKSLSQVQKLLHNQQLHLNYDNIFLVDSNGMTYDVDQDLPTFLAFDDDVRADLLSEKQGMATAQIINNKERILFSTPINSIVIDGIKIIALAASYDPAVFNDVLSMTSFNDQAYSQIITKSGTTVTRATSPYAIKSGYNIFTTLQNAQLDSGYDMEAVRSSIKNDQGDQISFSLDSVHWYMVYTPIQPDAWYLLTFVPFQAVNAKSDMLLQTTLVICGFIVLTFCALIGLLLYIFRRNKRKLEQIAYVDDVTGGNTIQRFYQLARDILDSAGVTQYALIYTNIENFKVLNSQLGRQNCDDILQRFTLYTTGKLDEKECMGRLSADNFCLLLRYQDEETFLNFLRKWASGAEEYIQQSQVSWTMPVTEFGAYVIENINLPFPEMIDRAKLALKNAPLFLGNKMRYALYDDTARRKLFREKQLTDMMEDALKNGEYKLFLQPKYHLPDERIGGAEALVRWVSTTEGMIFPDDFIPLFEKNGFIVQLDLYMFEQVCRTVRRWKDQGLPPVKISVNCSRIHFRNPQFLLPFIKIAEEHQVDKSLLEIELTESVVFENSEQLTRIIQLIRGAGFGCSMDDFGSGYSSLNLIQNIPVDTLKIDKIFFQGNSEEGSRTEAVVGSIVQMAKSLSLTTVAEGVEYREQVDMLKRVGCDYIQGYVFAKPMNVDAFEKLAYGEKE